MNNRRVKFPLFLILFGAFVYFYFIRETSTTTDPFQHISDETVKTHLKKAFEAAGGLNNWQSIKKLHFKKDFKLLDSAGTVERAALQQHDYTFLPQPHIKISWEDSLKHSIVSQNGALSKIVNGKVDTLANPTSLNNTVLAATFVISIPFKLLDEGVSLNYDGSKTLKNGQKVEVIRATYNTEEHEHHSTPDTWWHYFDANTYRQVGYMVFHVDHFSYVENLSFEEVEGFVFPKERKSFRADSLGNTSYLRADYLYSDYVLEFD